MRDLKITLVNPIEPRISIPSVLKPLIQRRRKAIDTLYKAKFGALDSLRGSKISGYNLSIGLLQVASYVENLGFEVEYLQEDYLLSQKRWRNLLQRALNTSDVIAFTSTTPTYYESCRINESIKEENPHILTVIGGTHASFNWSRCLQDNFDIVVIGEGEQTFKDLLLRVSRRQSFQSVKGIAFRHNNQLKINPSRTLLKADDIPIPAYHLLEKDLVSVANPRLCASVGCPYKCSFCTESLFWEKTRFKSPERVIREIEVIKDIFKANYLHFFDSTFNLSQSRVDDLTDTLQRNFPDSFFSCNMRLDKVNSHIMRQLDRSNFLQLDVGIESGSDKVLASMNKGITFSQICLALRKMRTSDSLISTYWIVGHPGETTETATESIQKLKYLYTADLIDDSLPRAFVPYPGTPQFKNKGKLGLEILDDNWENYGRWNFPPVHQLDCMSRYEIYFYFLTMFEIGISMINKKYNLVERSESEQTTTLTKGFPFIFGRADPSLDD